MKNGTILAGNAAVAAGLWATAWYFTKKRNTAAAVIIGTMAGFSTISTLMEASRKDRQALGISAYLRGPSGLIGMNQYHTEATGYIR